MSRKKLSLNDVLAVLAIAGISSAGIAQAGNGQGLGAQRADGLKAIDRSSILLARGKSSGCAKCGANGCGKAFMERMIRKHASHSSKQVRAKKKAAKRSQSR